VVCALGFPLGPSAGAGTAMTIREIDSASIPAASFSVRP